MADRSVQTRDHLIEQQLRIREDVCVPEIPERNALIERRHSGSWEWNFRLAMGTVLFLVLAVAAGVFLHNRAAAQIPPSLLALADKAEKSGDWRLAAARLSQYLRIESGDVEVLRRLGDLYYEHATTPEESQRGARMYALSFKDSGSGSPVSLQTKLRHATLVASFSPSAALIQLDALIPNDQRDMLSRFEKRPELKERIQATHIASGTRATTVLRNRKTTRSSKVDREL